MGKIDSRFDTVTIQIAARNLRQGVRKVVLVDSGRRLYYAQAK